MLIDCDECAVRGLRCDDCVLGRLLGSTPVGEPLDEPSRAALAVLAEAGLTPPLWLALVPPAAAWVA